MRLDRLAKILVSSAANYVCGTRRAPSRTILRTRLPGTCHVLSRQSVKLRQLQHIVWKITGNSPSAKRESTNETNKTEQTLIWIPWQLKLLEEDNFLNCLHLSLTEMGIFEHEVINEKSWNRKLITSSHLSQNKISIKLFLYSLCEILLYRKIFVTSRCTFMTRLVMSNKNFLVLN